MDKKYESFPIPDKENLSKKELIGILRGVVDRILHPETVKLDEDPFAEIQISVGFPEIQKPALKPSPVQPRHTPQNIPQERDSVRAKFSEMRRLAGSDSPYLPESPRLFYRQAVFMRDFEDDYDGEAAFSSFYPSYQSMGYEQLRTYFTWRTNVRRGSVDETSTSYAFLYVYELLNNIGVESPDNGLIRLMNFWSEFRKFDDSLDKYLPQWLKDYHVCYQTSETFREFATRYRLRECYPSVFAPETGEEDSYEIFAVISKYDVKKSIFLTEETINLYKNVFWFTLNRIREAFLKNGKTFEDSVFYLSEVSSVWVPFKRATFYNAGKQTSRKVAISDREVYTLRYGNWVYTPFILTESGRQLVGFIMKSVEAELRKAEKFKYKITANMNMLDDSTLRVLKSMEIDLSELIRISVAEYFIGSTRREVLVNPGNLEKIRREALDIQEKLIIPEEIVFIKINEIDAHENSAGNVSATSEKTGVWEQFRDSLTSYEFEALRLIIRGASVNKFASENAVMPEVLIDGINQKAVDYTGDTVIEYDGGAVVYDDYREYLEKVI